MAFQYPLALILLLLLVPIVWIGRPARGYGRGRELAALILRIVIVVLLVLAAAGLELRQANDALAVVFLVDVSDSMPEESRSAARTFIEEALEAMRPDDQAAVILFGAEALVERTMSPDQKLAAFSSVPDTSQTDYAEAVRLAMALYPPDSVHRMVLLSDGRQTTGDAAAAARLSVESGVEFLVVPLADPAETQEVTLLDVNLPARLIAGESFYLKLTVHAREPTTIFMRIFAGGTIAFEGTADLEAGSQDFRIPLAAGEPGFSPYTVQISASIDEHVQNNRLTAFTHIEGPPKVLVVAPEPGEKMPFSEETRPDEAFHLVGALEASGFTVDTVRPNGLPFELALLSEYASVVLVDVPARQLSNRQMDALQSYVRDLGGGLLAVGGPTSFGVGGYFRTPLEETLPVDMEIKDQERRPGLTMVFIIDRSGSMGDSSTGVAKLELAKEAAIRSVELLFPGDKVGVIAFDDAATWVVPITELNDPDAVTYEIERIGLGGGTDILAGLRAMANELPSDDAQVKHVILLTDGGASPIGIPNLVEEMFTQHGITLTTVGVGSDAAPFLEDIALIGGGRYHFTDRPEAIPSIFTEETTLASRSYIVEESFFPALASRSTILTRISSVPPLHGYVAATAKSSAQTILVSGMDDPILAAWQYGLGKALAWTSDASSRWARDWVNWENFQTFWAQAVRYTVSDQQKSPLHVLVEPRGEQAVITVDAVSENGRFLNGYAFSANVVFPNGDVQTIHLSQVEPGRYEAAFKPGDEGAYLLRLDGLDARGENALSAIAGWVRAYSPEYRHLIDDPDFLSRLADFAGGRLLTVNDAGIIYSNPSLRAAAGRPLWPELVTAGLLLLPFDIGVRRLALEKRDFVRAWHRISAVFVLSRAPAEAQATRPDRISNLLRAKDRAEQRRVSDKDPPDLKNVVQSLRHRETPPASETDATKKKETGKQVPSMSEKAPEEGRSTTAALLARKRARENQNRDKKNE